ERLDPITTAGQPAVEARLACEPERFPSVEDGRVQVGVAARRQGERSDIPGRGVDSHDGVEPAVGDPEPTVGTDDDAVRSRARAQLDLVDRSGGRFETAQLPGTLGRVPAGPIRLDRDV